MKKVMYFSSILFLVLCFATSSCKKDAGSTSAGQVEFTLVLDNPQSSLKSISDTTDTSTNSGTASAIIVTIVDASGNVVKNSEKIDLYSMSGSYITQPISLVSGSYKLTRFLVLDATNKVLYASPVTGSVKAGLVQQPLPIAFSTQTNAVTKLVPEVLVAKGSTPENFGYATFSFSVVQTFDFLVGAFIYNESLKNYQLTSATISVLRDSTVNDSLKVYSGQLSAQTNSTNVTVYDSLGVTNKITLPERYSSYKLVITKAGYKTYSKSFSKAELKLHLRGADKGPLVIVLEPVTTIPPTPVDSSFYIKGYFGSEYLNYSAIQIPGHQATYYSYLNNGVYSNSLYFIVFANTTASSRNIGLYIQSFNLDSITVPCVIPTTGKSFYGELQLINSPLSCKFCATDSSNYLGVTNGGAVTITIQSKANDIVVGTFSGKIATVFGNRKLTVSNGEFRGKINRITNY
jgi:hypothetical protein